LRSLGQIPGSKSDEALHTVGWTDHEGAPPFFTNTEEFQRCFDIVENILESGTDEVKAAVTVGFLEDLQNRAKESGITPDVFESLLGRNTRVWWDDPSRNWAAQTDW
jgi:hypothetical protein